MLLFALCRIDCNLGPLVRADALHRVWPKSFWDDDFDLGRVLGDFREPALLRDNPRWDADGSTSNAIGHSPLVVAGACNREHKPSSSGTGPNPRRASNKQNTTPKYVMDRYKPY